MYTFFVHNKKPLLTTWITVGVIFSAMIFGALPYMAGPPTDTEDKLIILAVTALGMPLFICLVLYLKFNIYSYKLRKNMKYKPFADFFAQNDFAIEWIDVNKYWAVAEKAVCGTFFNKKIVCRIDEKNMDRIDFVIYGLDPDKVNANQTMFRNIFDLEDPRFGGDLIYKSFNRTKTLTNPFLQNWKD